jgi:SpoVK/Ycf46/Vps4 family AAA+-type ATPase
MKLSASEIRAKAIELARSNESAVVEPAHIFLACGLIWPNINISNEEAMKLLRDEVNQDGRPKLVSVPRVSLRAEKILDQLQPFSEVVFLRLLALHLKPKDSGPNASGARPKQKSKKSEEDKGRNQGSERDADPIRDPIPARPLTELLNELNSLTGLSSVKTRVGELINLQKVNKARISKGLQPLGSGLNLVLLGEPGTGKTTVARIIGQIYGSLGLLERGHVVEVGRQDLVAKYIGQTALKVEKVIDSAMGGVLFIDEAYSLSPDGAHAYDFGHEAVAALIQLMENNRDKLAVFVAGYEKQMNSFLDSNPGLRSRFTNTMVFESYSPSEMVDICLEMISDLKITVSEAVVRELQRHFSAADYSGSAGNGRYARNVLDKMVSNMANRLGAQSIFETVALTSFTPEDVPVAKGQPSKGFKLGFQPE